MTRRDRLAIVAAEVSKFCTVGATSFVVDLTVFNAALLAGVGPLSAKTLAASVATGWAYIASRSWVFRRRGALRDEVGTAREFAVFVALNAVGLALALIPLGITYYVLEWRSALAQNVAANGVGLLLGMTFRFWAYRRWVFPEPEPVPALVHAN